MLGQAGKVPAISERDEAHRRLIRQEQEGAALRPVRQEQHENHFAVPHRPLHCTQTATTSTHQYYLENSRI